MGSPPKATMFRSPANCTCVFEGEVWVVVVKLGGVGAGGGGDGGGGVGGFGGVGGLGGIWTRAHGGQATRWLVQQH